MKCGQCKREGKRSRLYPGARIGNSLRDCMYYGEDSTLKYEHSSPITTFYSCSYGHRFKEIVKGSDERHIEELEPLDLPKRSRGEITNGS